MSDLDWQSYVEQAVKTAPEQSWDEQLKQATLGLSGEVGEALSSDDPEEYGDCFWYLALACDALGIEDLHLMGMAGIAPEGLEGVAFSLCESVESLLYQSDASARAEIKRALWSGYVRLCRTCPDDPHEAWQANLQKLRARHGDSFSPAADQER